MNWQIVSPELVIEIHDQVLNPGELAGLARDKSLQGALGRVEMRMVYGLINDAFDLAAAYVGAISQGHCFNDANRRTAFRVLQVVLDLNGIQLTYDTVATGQIIIHAAQRKIEEPGLADWLRKLADHG